MHEAIRAALADAAARLGAPVVASDIELERPRDPAHGDVATNLALVLAQSLKGKPRAVAERLVAALELPQSVVRKIDVAGPGFINFFLAEAELAGVLETVLAAGDRYGRSDAGQGRPVNVEFVSANPTGPLHVGHGRQAALGDAIASLLDWTGWRVTREFYYNDGGAQIMQLARSVQARIGELHGRPTTLPEGGYHGEYIRDIAERYLAAHPGDPEGADLDHVRRFAVQELRKEQDADLQALGVTFDVHFLESSLYTTSKVEKTLGRLVGAGHTYEKDGALWLKTTDFGDDKDRVMRKRVEKGGEYTYFLPDVAYHVDKWERGFARAINVQGADHHSTVTRVRIGLQALELGIPAGYPEYVLHQMVTVTKGGAEMKISKRAGSYMTVRELVDEVGRDAVRYFFLMRRGDSHLVFDVDLAKSQTEENPVFYVEMAHARLSGIFRVAGRAPETASPDGVHLAALDQPEELLLLKQLADFPSLVAGAAAALEPHRVTGYLEGLARIVHAWYHKYRVLGEPEEAARLVLARAVRQVLANGLSLMGVSAPDRM
ncbi:MAG: arginine--tRNA ligase [Gemmatimonadetes bacterium 13_2_20CM_2_69_23]|nr:MAG: arginine--tRNA ligase [Gemmatimonadetes bacterium 13_2_20CM_2_69_23]